MSHPVLLSSDETGIHRAAEELRAGHLVAFPTETVYGLGANAWDEAAVARIFAAKGRPSTHPLIVHVASIAEAKKLTPDFSPLAESLAAAFWPGPLTLVVRAAAGLPRNVTAGGDTVGIRIPAHTVAQQLLQAFGGPIAAPSANRHQEVSPTRAAHVVRSLGARAEFLLDGGACEEGIESTVISLVTGEILRPGPLSPARLRAFFPELVVREGVIAEAGTHAAPGLSRRHYAPCAKMELVPSADLRRRFQELSAAGETWALLRENPGLPPARVVCLGATPVEYARKLFAAFVEADERGAAHLLVEMLPESEEWWALRDRLVRAAAG